MLEVLRIKNIVLIDRAEICFGTGLNIISGETGTGKSIILEAISLLLGSRAKPDLIRSGCEEGVVEGLFNISNIPWVSTRLEESGFSSAGHELLIKRSVHKKGKHRISINGELATLSSLQTICLGLIDLCGQHEHQSLLRSSVQLELLDRFGGLGPATEQYTEIWNSFHQITRSLETLEKAQLERNQRTDFLKYQIEEIESAQLGENEEEELLREKQLLQTAEMRVQSADCVRNLLELEDQGALELLKTSLQKLRLLSQQDVRINEPTEAMERAVAEAEEVLLFLNRYLCESESEMNPKQLEFIQERLSILAGLKRKYGNTPQSILAYLAQIQEEMEQLQSMDEQISLNFEQREIARAELLKSGELLSNRRKKIAGVFSDSVTGELKDLKMEAALFQIDLEHQPDMALWSKTGAESAHFLVQTNPGEPSKPLAKIASGGELSRLMLAIRRVISNQGGIGVYLFDEIDSGIGGQTAFQVGKKLSSVAKHNQVICITHLPQVAAFADVHLVVEKVTDIEHSSAHPLTRTLTKIRALEHDQQKEELARMLGGPELTTKTLASASELLSLAAENTKKIRVEGRSLPKKSKSSHTQKSRKSPVKLKLSLKRVSQTAPLRAK